MCRGLIILSFLTLIGCTKTAGRVEAPSVPLELLSEAASLFRKVESPGTQAYLSREANYANSMLAPLAAKTATLRKEMARYRSEGPPSEPITIGNYKYLSKTAPGQRFPIIQQQGPERSVTILDLNLKAVEIPELQLLAFRISPSQEKIAFILREGPKLPPELFVQSIGGTAQSIARNVSDAVWIDDQSLAVTIYDSTLRPFKLLKVNESGASEELYHEARGQYHLLLSKPKIDRAAIVYSDAIDENQSFKLGERLVPLSSETPQVKEIFNPDRNGWFVLQISKDGGKLFSQGEGGERHQLSVKGSVEQVESFNNFLALKVLEKTDARVSIIDRNGAELFRLRAEQGESLRILPSPDFNAGSVRFIINSLIKGARTFEYTHATKSVHLVSEPKLNSATKSALSDLELRHIRVKSEDGTDVPLTVLEQSGRTPKGRVMIITAYGAYGRELSIDLEPARISLLKEGIAFGFCHTRGGGEFGRSWYEAGRHTNKHKVVEDYLACAEWAARQGWQVVGQARSAGAIAVGAALNRKPELFSAMIFDFPFLDLLGSMQNRALPLTERELSEWGDPDIASDLTSLKAICPFTNIKPKLYPPILVTAGMDDREVGFWQSLTWASKLRSTKLDTSPVIVRILNGVDHSGPHGQGRVEEELAIRGAFLAHVNKSSQDDTAGFLN